MPNKKSSSFRKTFANAAAYFVAMSTACALMMGWWWEWPPPKEWPAKLSTLTGYLTQLRSSRGAVASTSQRTSMADKPTARVYSRRPGQDRTVKQAGLKPKSLPPVWKKRPLPRPMNFRKPLPTTSRGRGPSISSALLLNGGGSSDSNYFSHHLHIQMFAEVLLRRGMKKDRISVFSSDGEAKGEDQLLSLSTPMTWPFRHLPEFQFVAPSLQVNTTLPGFLLRPARKKPLRKWLQREAKRLRKTRRNNALLLFVTDHGRRGKQGPLSNTIELWNESLTARELRGWLRPFGKRNRVVSVMSQCFSGGFAQLQYDARGRVSGNRCGFYATLATREAYGCFPETAAHKRVGYAYRMARAMRTSPTLEAAHLKTMLTDRTPDVPLRTTDVFVRHLLQRRAKLRGQTFLSLTDRWGRKALARRPQSLRKEWSLVRGIQKSFQLKKTRTLAATWKEIRKVRKQRLLLQKLETLWSSTTSNANHNEMLAFYKQHPALSARVLRELNKDTFTAGSFRVGRSLHRAFLTWLEKHRDGKRHLRSLYQRDHAVIRAIFRSHVTEAAYLRVATLQTRIAGLFYLRKQGSRGKRRAFRRLLACERTSLGQKKFTQRLLAEGPEPASPGPKNKKPTPTLAQLVPSFLGIQFQPAQPGWNRRFEKMAPGAVQVMGVMPGSPAALGGLRRGDVVVSIGGQMLQKPQQIRQIVMLSPRNKRQYFLAQRDGRFLPPLQITLQPVQGFEGLQNTRLLPALPKGQGVGTGVMGLPPAKSRKQSLFTLNSNKLKRMQNEKPTLLFFWATWCTACKQMVPMLERIQRVYPNVKLVAVTNESRWKVRRFLRDMGARFPFQTALDRRNKIHRRFRVRSLPTLVLLSKGKRLWRRVGMSGEIAAQLHRRLRTLQ